MRFTFLPRSLTDPHVFDANELVGVTSSELGDVPKGVPALSRKSVMLWLFRKFDL